MRIKTVAALTLALLVALTTALLLQLPVLAQTETPEAEAYSEDPLWQTESITQTLFTSLVPTTTLGATVPQTGSLGVGETGLDPSTSEGDSASGPAVLDWVPAMGVPMEVMEWEQEQADSEGVRLGASYDYPATLDWRTFGGRDWTTPVRNQGACGACVAFGTTGAIESRLEIALGDPTLNPDLSEAHLFFCNSGTSCSSGWYPSAALDAARDTGITDEACQPYDASAQACTLCPDWKDRLTRIDDWVGLTNEADMKQTLADHGPFEATMIVYSDFFGYSGGVYRHTSGQLVGGHAVTVVGYNDEEGYWIVKNSWGSGWGENGWFKIAYGECGIDDYVYVPVFEMPAPSFQLFLSVAPSDGGTIVSEPLACLAEACEFGTQIMLTAVPADGYEFAGWEGDVIGDDESISIVVDSDKNVTARFSSSYNVRVFVPFVVG
jgi:hypothetical protein